MLSEGVFMSDNQARFEEIREKFIAEQENVLAGKMMSSEAITYKKKVFAFYMTDDSMGFKLGREFQAEAHDITDYNVLSPFKNKAPMLDWLLIPDSDKWEELADIALKRMKAQLD